MMKEFIKVLKENPSHAYDYICNNYHKFSKEELKDITKELLYGIYDNSIAKIEHDTILSSVAEELKDIYDEE